MTKLRFTFLFLMNYELSFGHIRQSRWHSDPEFEITIENGESYVPVQAA